MQAKLTGVINVGAALDNETPKHGALIAPNLYAPIHQHFFCIRLDLALDGTKNSVYEVNIVPEKEGAHNSQNNGYYPDYRLLKIDSEAMGQVDARKHRLWKIVYEMKLVINFCSTYSRMKYFRNSNSVNQHTGQPVAYRLESHGNAYPYAGYTVTKTHFKNDINISKTLRPNASVTKRAGFMKNHVWITNYEPDQLYAAGKYPNQHPGGGDGLEKWTSGNKPIVDTDLVLW